MACASYRLHESKKAEKEEVGINFFPDMHAQAKGATATLQNCTNNPLFQSFRMSEPKVGPVLHKLRSNKLGKAAVQPGQQIPFLS